MIARILWIVAIALIAVVSTFAQLDRTARTNPEYGAFVPRAFQSFSAANLTASALAQENGELALQRAAQLVEARPMRQEHHRMLAQAQLMLGQDEQAIESIQRGARAGWRDPMTQEALLRLAIAAGNDVEATRRLAALWAVSKTVEPVRPYASQVLNRESAQTEMARLLKSNPRWAAKFNREAPRLLAPETRSAIDAIRTDKD